MVNYYEWESSEFIPIFHEKKFTEDEFLELCKTAYEKVKFTTSSWIPGKYMAYASDVAKWLVENKGFTFLNDSLLTFVTNDCKIEK